MAFDMKSLSVMATVSIRGMQMLLFPPWKCALV
jgi:hypothetical protein